MGQGTEIETRNEGRPGRRAGGTPGGRMAALLLPLLLAGGTGACDPCFATTECRGGATFSAQGQVVDQETRRGVPGVRVTVVVVDPAGAPTDSATAVTDASGRYTVRIDAAGADSARVVVRLRPEAPWTGYDRHGIPIAATRGGDVTPLGTLRVLRGWKVGELLELFVRATGEPVAGRAVEFRVTGGVPASPSPFAATTNAEGRAWITPVPAAAGEVVGDVVAFYPGQGTLRTPGVRLRTSSDPDETFARRIGVGPYLSYQGRLVRASDGAPLEGLEVEFRRTGGVPATPESFVARSGPDGRFFFDSALADPFASGELVGTLTVRPQGGAPPVVVPELRLPTFEADETRVVEIPVVLP